MADSQGQRTEGLRTARWYLLLVGPVLLGMVLLVLLLALQKRSAERELIIRGESHVVSEQQLMMQGICEDVAADLLVLADDDDLTLLDREAAPEVIADVAEDFLAFSRHNPAYDQIRFLDTGGREILRVDNRASGPRLVPADELQVKAHRYYFAGAIGLQAGVVYLSPLDLNIEHGAIEVPHVPMLRLATAVVDGTGATRGVVVINYKAAGLLGSLHHLAHFAPGQAMLLDREGYWLFGPDPDATFGFMFDDGADRTMAVRQPIAWAAVAGADKGSVETDEGLYVWSTIRPVPREVAVSAEVRPGEKADTVGDYAWKLVSFVAAADMRRAAWQGMWRVLLPVGLALLLYTMLAWRLAGAIERRQRAEEALRDLNAELERRVAQRTEAWADAMAAKEMAEDELRRTTHVRALGRLAANVAHDFNNILAPVIGYAELVRGAVGDDEDLAGDADEIIGAAGRGRELVGQILSLGDEGELVPAPVDLEGLLAEIARQCQAPANITVHHEIASGCPAASGESVQLHRALTNLCRNAVQAMTPEGGELMLSAAGEGDMVRIEVLDTGPGIPSESLGRIFEPYYSTRREKKGTGLGLATVHAIVTRHGGRITVESTPGQGANFILRLPAVRRVPA